MYPSLHCKLLLGMSSKPVDVGNNFMGSFTVLWISVTTDLSYRCAPLRVGPYPGMVCYAFHLAVYVAGR